MLAIYVSGVQVGGAFERIETHVDRFVCVNGEEKLDVMFLSVPGATIEDYVAPPPSAEEQAQAAQAFQAAVVTATQARLDTFANTRNYDGILSACTYASSAVPKFQSEGQYCVNARDNTWAALYTLMADVQAGTTPMPATVDEVMALLPELTWPA